MMLMFIVNPIYFSMQCWSMKHWEEVLIIYSIVPIIKSVKSCSRKLDQCLSGVNLRSFSCYIRYRVQPSPELCSFTFVHLYYCAIENWCKHYCPLPDGIDDTWNTDDSLAVEVQNQFFFSCCYQFDQNQDAYLVLPHSFFLCGDDNWSIP